MEIAGWRSQVGDRREVQDPGQVQDPSRSRGESELEEEIELSGMMDRADQFERLEERRRSLSREIERHERSMSSQGVRFREKEGESGSSSDDTEKKGLPVRVKTEGSVVDPGDSFALSSGEDVSQWALVGKEMGLTGEALGRFVTDSIRNAELKEERREELRLKKRRDDEELRIKAIRDDEELRLKKIRDEEDKFRLDEALRIKAIRDDEELRLKKIRDEEDKFRLDEALRLKAIRDDEELRLKKRMDDEELKLKEEELRLKARREEEDKFRLDEELRLKERRDDEGLRLRREEVESNRDYQGRRLENDETKNVKIEPLRENDDVDAFVAHFEQVAGLCRWSKASWSSRIIALLKGKAREAVLRLTSTQLTDYDEVKTALLVHFRLDAEAYRKKFRGMRKEGSETFEQALTRMKRWFSLWCKAAKKDETDVDDVKDLLLQEQMYRMFNSEFTVEVRRTCPRTVDEVAREATVFAEAKWMGREERRDRDNVLGPTGVRQGNKPPSAGQPTERTSQGDKQSKPAGLGATYPGSQIVCFRCKKKGHVSRHCPEGILAVKGTESSGTEQKRGPTPALCGPCSKKSYSPNCVVSVNGSPVQGLLAIKGQYTTPYHAQCNGLVERFNGTLKRMLRSLVHDKPKQWDRWIPALLFAYREVPQSSTGFFPFEMLYGRKVRGPMRVLKDLWVQPERQEVKTAAEYVVDLRNKIAETCAVARENLGEAATKHKRHFDLRARPRQFVERVSPAGDTVAAIVIEEEVEREPETVVVRKDIPVISLEASEGPQDVEILTEDEVFASQLREVTASFSQVLTDVPSCTTLETCHIKVRNEKPVRCKPYPVPFAQRETVREEVKSMLSMGVIEPSVSPYCSPIVLVKKRDGKIRFCVDFRQLNKVVEFDSEPMPDVEYLFAKLGDKKVFSKIDLSKGYWQIPLEEGDRPKTAFSTPEGHFQWKVMPFGLCTSGAVFSRMMRKLLQPLQSEDVDNFIDDILIATVDNQEHIKVLKAVLQKLQDSSLTARPSKCSLVGVEVTYLGHKIGKGEIRPGEDKMAQILEAPRPTTKKQVRSFLGLIGYYRRFVPHFAEVAKPLTDLTKGAKARVVVWNEQCEQAFQSLKHVFCEPPVCNLPVSGRRFVLQTDASENGIGAMLCQEYEDGLRPVSCASKKLKPAELNYPIIEKECLAMVWGIQHFERYLYGNPFLVQTDHSPLQYLDRVKSASGRITRWALLLQPFQFTIEAIPGNENVSADFLSRIPDKESVHKVRTVQGDVLSCPPSEALAHCVSQDLEMGAGIAVEFKARFGGQQELKRQGKVVGEVAVLKREERFVYYLVTKRRFHDRPTYKTLRASLEAMKRHCNANHVVRLSVPQIGCGIDGLKWEKVSDMLAEVFKDRTVTVTAYVL
ncbi:hypothetical protein ACOMHN_060000 [Nucella lapillus]